MNIKFRAWHKELGIMAEVAGLDDLWDWSDYGGVHVKFIVKEKNYSFCGNEQCKGDCGKKFIQDEKWENWNAIDIELMQWSGHSDCNNVEIYEGDILDFYDCNNEFRFRTTYWSNIGKDPENYNFNIPTAENSCKVVGNIFENIELLNNTQDVKYDQI